MPFSITLNNHTLAAVTTLAAIYPLLHRDDAPSPLSFATSGFFAGLTCCLELPAAAFLGLLGLAMLWRDWRRTLLLFAPMALVPIVAELWVNHAAVHLWVPVYSKFGGPWYLYPGSHWAKSVAEHGKISIDFARHRESIYVYWFHVLIGHHGLFSLTPIWLLSVVGLFASLRRGKHWDRVLAAMTLPLSLIVIGFYLLDSDNYGGWTSGLRWLIWLTPLWLLTLLPIADRLATSVWGRRLGYALLVVSVFSAAYPAWNPWRHPWIYHLLEARGWLPY